MLQRQTGKGALSALYPWLREWVNEVPLVYSKQQCVIQKRKENGNEEPVGCSVGHVALTKLWWGFSLPRGIVGRDRGS